MQADDNNLCSICFEQVCTIEVQNCGHRLCAHCTLSLCCHNKPNPSTASVIPPVCPFCRGPIAHLTVAKFGNLDDPDHDVNDISSSKLRRLRRSSNLSEGSDSFRGLSSALGSLGKFGGRGSGRIAIDDDYLIDKPWFPQTQQSTRIWMEWINLVKTIIQFDEERKAIRQGINGSGRPALVIDNTEIGIEFY